MKFRYLYIGLFLLISSSLFCQQNFTENEKKRFVQVYMTFKIENKRDQNIDRKLFEKYNISPNRYQVITNSALTNEEIELSADETNLIKKIRKENELEKQRKENVLSSLCENTSISKTTYSEILKNYKQDIVFQRSLKPYFDDYINKLK